MNACALHITPARCGIRLHITMPPELFTACLLVNLQVREASLPPEHWEESYHRLVQVGVLS